jgi:hypothetical protein
MAYLSYSTSFNGSTDSLTTPSNAAFAFGTGSFTVEMWFKKTGGPAQQCLMGGTSNQPEFEFDSNAGNSKLRIFDGANDVLGSTTIQNDVWYHVAWVRNSSNLRVYLNGVSEASVTSSTDYTSTQFRIGQRLGGTTSFTGYISNLRIVKGSAVYTSAFTPPTSPLTAISGTSLLTCQSATTIDNSTNGFSLTVAGSPVISNSDTPFITGTISAIYTRQIPSVVSTTKQSTELTSLDNTTINTSSLSIQVPNQKYIPGVSSTTKQTTELTSLDSTNNYSVTISANLVGKKEIPSVPSVTRFSTFIKTSNDPIVDAATATNPQTWTVS